MFNFLKYKLKLKIFQKKFRKQNEHNFSQIMNICDISKISIGRKSYANINLVDFSS